jgi:hypothetical protein
MYGSWVMLALYLVCGVAASALSYAFGPGGWSVGASGAIFGLFGVVLVATRFHHAILDAQSRAIAAQVGILIVLNLVIGFSGFLNVDNYAHVGGLLAGLWLAFVLPPGQVQTLASVWQAPRGARSPAMALALRVFGIVALVAVVGGIIAYGTSKWQADPSYRYNFPAGRVPVAQTIAAQPSDLAVRIEIVR